MRVVTGNEICFGCGHCNCFVLDICAKSGLRMEFARVTAGECGIHFAVMVVFAGMSGFIGEDGDDLVGVISLRIDRDGHPIVIAHTRFGRVNNKCNSVADAFADLGMAE